jgi:acyl carrier protein
VGRLIHRPVAPAGGDVNDDKLKRVVIEALRIDPADYRDDLKAGELDAWDSLGHVTLLLAVQKAFNVEFDPADMIEVESLADLRALLGTYSAGKPGM